MSQFADLERARKLFVDFHRREPQNGEISLIARPKSGAVVLEVGELMQLAYKRLDGKFFRHDFEQPTAKVFVTADGRQMFLVGGGYQFTRLGFVR